MKIVLLVLLFISNYAFAQINVVTFLNKKAGCYTLKDRSDGSFFRIVPEYDTQTETRSYSFEICKSHRCGGSSSVPVKWDSVFFESQGVLSFTAYKGSSYRYFSFSDIKSDEEFVVRTLSYLNGSSNDPEHDKYARVYHVEKKFKNGICP